MDSSSPAKVQHVNKKSSDELLRKFAELDSDSAEEAPVRKELRVLKPRKRSRRTREGDQCESPSNSSASLLERRSLLPLAVKRRSALLRQLGIGRSPFRARDNKSILGRIEKTWHKTVEGASKVFMEKHYHRHKRLINDIV
ncbi:hypothetical protein I3843_09G030400 [Carya illinoinensis]|uniref:Uncharacterized protein n=1 Tax=Carya illinoinensis TaxID=32201 RepID=A0A8T1PGI4_CARIL|nr:uncharacterized protein LOC122276057 [Carya illinoinensis]KAG2686931.1 hypothetical protein I3760_09G029600 [Carya illinoinensis]KAG6640823.1 hypothetical protein CIPAW_09G030300 [Carya illinoinensis]KAG6694045.1 hypothetical protein I3842_09G030400 [Carya illinoinensis]KAG7961717.1 hypothetical protein I3843_09G030400 [Carya illinoinensis]